MESKNLDVYQWAKMMVDLSTGQMDASNDGKNPAAVALGRQGGLKGGKARAEKLTAKQRSDIAKKAAKATRDDS